MEVRFFSSALNLIFPSVWTSSTTLIPKTTFPTLESRTSETASAGQSLMDWTDWDHTEIYDWIIGSDILYSDETHPHLRHIFEINLALSGRILLSDPFRETFKLLEEIEPDGWNISISRWNIGEESSLRPIGVFEPAPPT